MFDGTLFLHVFYIFLQTVGCPSKLPFWRELCSAQLQISSSRLPIHSSELARQQQLQSSQEMLQRESEQLVTSKIVKSFFARSFWPQIYIEATLLLPTFHTLHWCLCKIGGPRSLRVGILEACHSRCWMDHKSEQISGTGILLVMRRRSNWKSNFKTERN